MTIIIKNVKINNTTTQYNDLEMQVGNEQLFNLAKDY